MKTFYLLAILCIVGTNAGWLKRTPEDLGCARETGYHIHHNDEAYINQLKAGLLKPSNKLYNFICCLSEKAKTPQGKIHDGIMEIIAFGNLFGYVDLSTRKNLENTAIECDSQGLNNCDYLKCIKAFEPPFINALSLD